MKITRKITAILALLLTLIMIFTGCELLGGTGKLPAHSCESWCIECGKCTDLDCTEDICSEKCDGHGAAPEQGGIGTNEAGKFDLGCVPEPDFNAADFDGYCVINNNVPFFTDAEKHSTECFERYSSLDSLGRVGVAFACVCKTTMPPEGDTRGDIGHIKPTGWNQNTSYSGLNHLYDRSHLIAWSLTDEDDNAKNLATGTVYMNQHSMQIFENMVLNYLKSNKSTNKVLYRVTPVFNGDNLLCSGVLMEAYSLDDGGEDIQFCVFVYNVQEGVHLDYATGKNRLATSSDSPYYGVGAGFGTGSSGSTGNEGGNTGNEGGSTNPDNGNNQGGTTTPAESGKYIISASNKIGTLYFKGTITNGRFDGSYNVADAAEVTVSSVSGGYILSVGSNYIVISNSSSGASFTTDASAATVFEWNAELSTYVVAASEEAKGRAFGCQPTSEYENLSPYATSNSYNWGVFTKADGDTSTPDSGNNQGGTTTPDGGNTGTGDEKTFTFVLNTSSKKIHSPSCGSVSTMSEKNKQEWTGTYAELQELLESGYAACGTCKPALE